MSDAPATGTEHSAVRRLPLAAWHEPLYCHAPVDEAFDPAALGEGGGHADRWSRPGEPTAYLAADPGVALAELARHHRAGDGRLERRVLRLHPWGPGITGLVDLRDPVIRRAIDAPASLEAFLDREVARRIAAVVRDDARHLGLVVPSMAFLDDPARCNLVLFADRLGDLAGFLRPGSEVARLVIRRP